jgi:hypothetical protein
MTEIQTGTWKGDMVVKVRSKSSEPISFLRLAYSAPVLQQSTMEEIRRLTLPATKALPFVKLRSNDQPLWRPESFWHVEPTGQREKDVRLGRKYARQAIAAMNADHNSHLIAHIVQDIIKDATERRGKKARGRYSAAAQGFLIEISEAIAAAS